MKAYSILTGEWLEKADTTTVVADDDTSRAYLFGGDADPPSTLAAPGKNAPTRRG
jgi:hypothetical protein